MRRNCNLELRLVSPSVSFDPADYGSEYHPMLDLFKGSPNEQQTQQQQQQQKQQQKQLTIFYNGKMTACDVTELQARAIIMLASREMEERSSSTPRSCSPTSPLLPSQLQSPTGLSMKRSLQQFLQQRKNRAQAASPYHH